MSCVLEWFKILCRKHLCADPGSVRSYKVTILVGNRRNDSDSEWQPSVV